MNRLISGMRYYYTISRWPEHLAPLLDIGIRLLLADAFFKSGLTKIKNWDSTLFLFSDVYQVPLLDPGLAAYLATGAELALPVLLVIGFCTRFAAAGLFILNAVAAYSYYSELSEAGLDQHLYWGILTAVLLVISRSRWSLDTLLQNRFLKEQR